jgi:hypothetical protein
MVSESNLQIPSLSAATRSPRWQTPIKEKWKNWDLDCAMLEDNNEITLIGLALMFSAVTSVGNDQFLNSFEDNWL